MRPLTALLIASLFAAHASAQESPPVAIRWWGQGMVSIETYWNLTIVIDPYNDKIGYEVPNLTADLVLVSHEHADHNNVEAVKGEPRIVRGLDDKGTVASVFNVLGRASNERAPVWSSARTKELKPPHAIHVTSIPAWHDDSQGSERGAVAMFKIVVDGVSIVHCGDLGQSKLTQEQVYQIGEVDVLLLPVGGVYTIDGNGAWDIVAQVKPRCVVPIHYKTDKLKIPLEPVDRFVEHMPEGWELAKPPHNTLALSPAKSKDTSAPQLVVLNYKPHEPSGDLATLLDKMDASCKASQRVFAPLTANQMNWQPPDGTHTARWNAEHMMGRQLGFFSEIYAAIEPETFSHIDLNPAQMPPEYKPAHADWDGAEEARQMERADAYVQRYAYLLDGVDLDQPAPGSRWTLRKLLEQMDRHFTEHTANVQKKFDLEGWPTE
ncbi:MBL fold metallo-hydrolase [Aeoliella sp. SH292]|uniref:MBL fold metallo-hydrolase n=1 Tax=Aeoliella sp. SH292 TaxID=3454464 RepID=UPI003F9A4DEB